MQQRRLRLGDIVDDYCPRERRITNHAVVAMIEDEVKQTRCTTCDAEHEYKEARVPAQRRRKDAPAALTADLLAAAPRKRPAEEPSATDTPETFETDGDAPYEAPAAEAGMPAAFDAQDEDGVDPGESREPGEEPAPQEDDGPVHRPLFRAKLPRPEGQLPERKLPDFTIHQRDINGNRPRGPRRGPRPGQMRGTGGQPPRFGGQRQGPGGGQGQRQHGGRPGPPRSGQGQGQPGQRPNRHGGGRKRGR
jgi:translation initiation factor IF-2